MKEVLINILEFMLKQLREDKCTTAQIQSIHNSVVTSLAVDASIKDIAQFYGKTENAVSNVIKRRPSKPRRRVFYNLAWFDKIKPSSWSCQT